MNPFHGMEAGEECLGTIAMYGLNTKRLLKTGIIRKGVKTVRMPAGAGYRTVESETYFYRGEREFERVPGLEVEA